MNDISVTDLSKGDDDAAVERTPPNPIQTFRQAFAHYRTLVGHFVSELVQLCILTRVCSLWQ